MCGLTGFLDFSNSFGADQQRAIAAKMRDTLYHRGPDANGSWHDLSQGIALAHTRLAIIDLSEHGHQPMLSANSRYVLSFNGEIYNHAELRRQIACDWRGHSDTEVILEAFNQFGIKATLQQMVGMWALALWDRQERKLYLSRDRLGEKPLYYGWLGNCLVFGSELKSLRQHPHWQQDINHDALSMLLSYNSIPAPHSIYQGIYKLKPATLLQIDNRQQITEETYWSLAAIANQGPTLNSPEAAVDALEHSLNQAVKLQMLADVPVGAFLSGGIDSSTVAAIMQANSSQAIKTFTIGFAENGYDEAKSAKLVAAHLGTCHTELYLSADDAKSIIPELPTYYDEPFADSSQLPTLLVARLTKQHVKVSLSGDGGDELFAGYNRYWFLNNLWRKLSLLPLWLRRLLVKILQSLPNNMDKLHKLATVLDASSEYEIYQRLISHWPLAGANHQMQTALPKRSLIENLMYQDTLRYLPDDILVKVDRAAMAVSLETRMPLLDHRVVETAWQMPLAIKLRHGQSKWPLRQILAKHIPTKLFDRPKQGFGIPLASWLRGPLREWANDLLSNSMLAKHQSFDDKLITQKWQEHLKGTRNWHYHLWDVLMFQAWYQETHA